MTRKLFLFVIFRCVYCDAFYRHHPLPSSFVRGLGKTDRKTFTSKFHVDHPLCLTSPLISNNEFHYSILRTSQPYTLNTNLCSSFKRNGRQRGSYTRVEGKSSNSDARIRGQRRKSRNNKVAFRWVIESIENILKEEQRLRQIGSPQRSDAGSNSITSTYKKEKSTIEDDCRLLNILSGLSVAKTEKSKSLLAKDLTSLNLSGHNAIFSYSIQERVMKATAMAGLTDISLQILNGMIDTIIDGKEREKAAETFSSSIQVPTNQTVHTLSPIAYTAVLSSLRQQEHMDEFHDTMRKLGAFFKKTGEQMDVVALNIYLASLCHYGVKLGDSKMIDNAIQLLHPNVAKERFSSMDPETYSFNTVLNVLASMKNSTLLDEVVGLMERQQVHADIYTYNARLKAFSKSYDEASISARLSILKDLMHDPNVIPDQYSIEMVLVPLARSFEYSTILELLKNWDPQDKTRSTVSNAYSTFLLALVKGKEVEIARAVFDTFIFESGSSKLSSSASTLEDYSISPKVKPVPTIRHINALIEGYREAMTRFNSKLHDEERLHTTPKEHAMNLLETMQQLNLIPDVFTITMLMDLQTSVDEVTLLWERSIRDFNLTMSSPVYHSIMTAYGRNGDPGSACAVFDAMIKTRSLSHSLNSWNVLFSVLSKASARDPYYRIDCKSSQAAIFIDRIIDEDIKMSKLLPGNQSFSCIADGFTITEVTMSIFDLMKQERERNEGSTLVLRPNAQTYCLVASVINHKCQIKGKAEGEVAMELYRDSVRFGIPADGRFLNAIIRCYGDNIEDAINAWKSDYRAAAWMHERRAKHRSYSSSKRKEGKNVIAGYHGLFNVAGQAGRPDIGLRLAYAMRKEGIEPTETALNCYNTGVRLRDTLEKSGKRKKIRMMNQYQSLLAIECTKYNHKDRRRRGEKRLRIIL